MNTTLALRPTRTYTLGSAAPFTSGTAKLVVKAQMNTELTSFVFRGVYPGAGAYQLWGLGNNYPQLMLDAINGSPTGATCVATKAKIIAGNGFADTIFYQASVNRQGLQVDTLLDLQTKDLAALDGFCGILNINGNGYPCEVLHAPFAQWRPAYADSDGIVRWDFIIQAPGTLNRNTLKNVGPVKYYRYNPKETPAQRAERIRAWCVAEGKSWAEYPGEMFVFYHKRSGALNHPRPLHDAVLRQMMTEASLAVSRHVDVRQGYAAQVQITEYGTAKPSAEKIAADTLKYGEFIGEDATRLVVQYALNKESKPDVDTFTVNDASKRYATDEASLKATIRAVFLLPTILYGESQAGKLGDSQEFDDAVAYATRIVVNADQRAIELFYKSIFSQFVPVPAEGQLPIAPGQFNPSGNYTIQQLSLRDVPTEEAEPSPSDKLLGKLAGLPVLLANKLLESLTEDEIRELMDKQPKQPATTTAAQPPVPAPAA